MAMERELTLRALTVLFATTGTSLLIATSSNSFVMPPLLVLVSEVALLGAVTVAVVYFVFLLPPRHPQNIPAIPFWIALLPFFKDVDQSEIFARYIAEPLRAHGAVKLFFGAQWNVLVHQPALLAEIFRHEDVYQKSGNQKKIPHSVLAAFLGDNIISSHGETWKTYRAVIKPGLQRNFDARIIAKNATRLCVLIQQAMEGSEQGRGIAVQDLLQRYSVANCSEALLDMGSEALQRPDAPLNVLQTAVKREIFKPIFMNFPVLDRLPFPSRNRARALVAAFKNELKSALVRAGDDSGLGSPGVVEDDKEETTTQRSSSTTSSLRRRMLAAAEAGLWTEKQLQDNLTVLFVAGQENPQLLMISTLYLLAKHPAAQDAILAEMLARGTTADDDDEESAQQQQEQQPYLTSVIYESLRLFPPIGQLINRRVHTTTVLSSNNTTNLLLPSGTYLGYNSYATNRDPISWGPDADQFIPERWGKTAEEIRRQYRARRARAEFISFHGGKRACLGERFAMLQMRVTIGVLVTRFKWKLEEGWMDRMTAAGPLYPRALRLVFWDREKGEAAR